jgi:hypothetical protein
VKIKNLVVLGMVGLLAAVSMAPYGTNETLPPRQRMSPFAGIVLQKSVEVSC